MPIEQIRFGDRVQIIWDVPPKIKLFVPPLSIQTLVENAIQHGVLPLQEGGSFFEIRIIFIFSNQKRLGLQKSQVFLG